MVSYQVIGIDCTPGFEGIEFSDGSVLALGKSMGDVDENLIKRAQIRRTIEVHFEKELRYAEKGIKVLSLFFIDEVAKYRTAEGEKGIYATMFEECYAELLALPKFVALRERFNQPVSNVHDGYFSQDKKGNLKNTKGDTADDYNTYNTIMRDKELLLSFGCPLRFIFSHSALKEGWDKRMIQDALSTDTRITGVRDFTFDDGVIGYTIDTIYGSTTMNTGGVLRENL